MIKNQNDWWHEAGCEKAMKNAERGRAEREAGEKS
jgi:hypothetical protein